MKTRRRTQFFICMALVIGVSFTSYSQIPKVPTKKNLKEKIQQESPKQQEEQNKAEKMQSPKDKKKDEVPKERPAGKTLYLSVNGSNGNDGYTPATARKDMELKYLINN